MSNVFTVKVFPSLKFKEVSLENKNLLLCAYFLVKHRHVTYQFSVPRYTEYNYSVRIGNNMV